MNNVLEKKRKKLRKKKLIKKLNALKIKATIIM